MASDCIFYSESKDMGATIPFCNFEDSSDWNCCKYYDHRDPTQELCPHYISRKDGLEILRRTRSGVKFYYCEDAKAWPDKEAEAHSPMTRREKWLRKVPDRYIEATICDTSRHIGDDCPDCPIKKLCMDNNFGSVNEYEKYMAAVSKWLDEEVTS